MSYVIRLASLQDASLMCELMHQAFAVYNDPPSSALKETADSIGKKLEGKEQAALLFTEQNVLVGLVRFIYKRDSIHFHRFCIHPAYQGNGLGGLLLNWLEEFAQSEHIATLACKVRTHATQNIAFYEKYGYIEVKEWQPSQPHSTPVLLFTKSVPKLTQKKTHITSF